MTIEKLLINGGKKKKQYPKTLEGTEPLLYTVSVYQAIVSFRVLLVPTNRKQQSEHFKQLRGFIISDTEK